jgi:hypothetical protein
MAWGKYNPPAPRKSNSKPRSVVAQPSTTKKSSSQSAPRQPAPPAQNNAGLIYSSFDNAYHPPSWFGVQPAKKASAPVVKAPAKKVAAPAPIKAVAAKVVAKKAVAPVKAVAKVAAPVKKATVLAPPAKKAVAKIAAPVKKATTASAPVSNGGGRSISMPTVTTKNTAPNAIARSLTAQTSPGTVSTQKVLNGPGPTTSSSGRPFSSKAEFEAKGIPRSPTGTAQDLARTVQGMKQLNSPQDKTASVVQALARAAQQAKLAAAASAVGRAQVGTAANAVGRAQQYYNPNVSGGSTSGGGGVRTPTPTAPIPRTPTPVPAPIPGGGTTAPPAPPTTTPTIPTNPTGSFNTTGGYGTSGRFARQRQNRGPRSGLSMTPELLQRLARQRFSQMR